MHMSLSVCQVLESVENEEGRFRTLRDVVFVTSRVYGIGLHDLY